MSDSPQRERNSPVGDDSEATIISPVFLIWPARILLVATTALVFGPVLYNEVGPAEVAKWHLAAARDHHANSRSKAALESYQRAIDRHPSLWLSYQERAVFHSDRGEYDLALQDWDRSVKRFPLDQRTETARRFALAERGTVLLHLKRFDEVIEEAKRLVAELEGEQRDRRQRRIFALNWLAYTRALANRDADVALEEIDESIQLLREEAPSAWPDASLIDTRGFVLYRLKQFDQAKSELDLSIKLLSAAKTPPASDSEAAKTMAVIYYHRGLVHDALGDKPAANADFEKVRELGFTPSPDLF